MKKTTPIKEKNMKKNINIKNKFETIILSLKTAIPVFTAYNKNKLLEYKILLLLLISGTVTVGILKLNLITNLISVSDSLLENLKIYSIFYLILTYLLFIFNLKNHIRLLINNFIEKNYTISFLSLTYLSSKIIFLYYLIHFYFILFNLNLISYLHFYFAFLMIFSFSCSFLLSFEVEQNIKTNVKIISNLSLCIVLLSLLLQPVIYLCSFFTIFSISSLFPTIYCDWKPDLTVPTELQNQMKKDDLKRLRGLHKTIVEVKGDIRSLPEFQSDTNLETGMFLGKIFGDTTAAEMTSLVIDNNKDLLKLILFGKSEAVGLGSSFLNKSCVHINDTIDKKHSGPIGMEHISDFVYNQKKTYHTDSPLHFLSLAYWRNIDKDLYAGYVMHLIRTEKQNMDFKQLKFQVEFLKAEPNKIRPVADVKSKLLK